MSEHTDAASQQVPLRVGTSTEAKAGLLRSAIVPSPKATSAVRAHGRVSSNEQMSTVLPALRILAGPSRPGANQTHEIRVLQSFS